MTRRPTLGIRVVGPTWTRRIVVDHAAAFAGYAAADPLASVDREGYLSAFRFASDFRQYFADNGNSEREYGGVCWSDWLWLDVDRTDLGRALDDARRLAATILSLYADLDGDDLLLFFSGSKGCHVGIPTAAWQPEPDPHFHRFARAFCERLAALAGVAIDAGVYSLTRLFRAPNSRHRKTGRHKRRFDFDSFMGMKLESIERLAERPEPFEVPAAQATCEAAAADWQAAVAWTRRQADTQAARQAALADGAPALNRQTLDFIREGADEGNRHRRLYSATRNLAELGCPTALAHALLTDAALDCGLTPRDVHRQIECGLKDHGKLQRDTANG
jgi:hypothetical protein